MSWCVYIHISPKGKKYVGITGKPKPEYRWNRGEGYRQNSHFYRAIKKYGWDNFLHVVVAENLTKEEACKLEKTLIQKWSTTNEHRGYNHSTGGEGGGTGIYFTEARRKRIGETHRGMKHTESAKKRMSEGHKGLITWNKGRSWSAEEKQTFMKAQKSKPVVCIETGIVYYGARDAERKTGIGRTEIRLCCHGRKYHRTAGGFHWKFVTLDDYCQSEQKGRKASKNRQNGQNCGKTCGKRGKNDTI